MSGRIWCKFLAKTRGGCSVKLRIQDLPKSRMESAVELFAKYNVNEETFLKAAGVPRNPKAVEEYRLLFTEYMKDPAFHHMICCEDEEQGKVGKIVGVSSMALVTVGRYVSPYATITTKIETKEMRKFIKLDEASNLHEKMKKLQMLNYYDDIGLIVHPLFRKLGIAMEFAKARRLACMAYNVAASGAMITSSGTDKVAKKDNWETVKELDLEGLGQQHGVTFEAGAVSKLVIWRNPLFKP